MKIKNICFINFEKYLNIQRANALNIMYSQLKDRGKTSNIIMVGAVFMHALSAQPI